VAATDIYTDRLGAEYAALTAGRGLLDRSERGKLALSGPDAKGFLAGQVTNDVEALAPGTGCYAAFLTHRGKMLGDLRVLDVGDELLLDTERVTLQALFDMIRRFRVGYDLELHKRTLERGLLSLIGPDAARIAGAEELGEATEHTNAPVEIAGIAAIAVRTDTGVDLICDATDTDHLLQTLRERGATPVSEDAAEIVRVERGRPRYGVDLDDSVIPQEAGLNERAVSFTKGCYVGQETVARLYYRGKPNRHLRGLRLSGPAAVAGAAGAELRLGERALGRCTSAVLSPAYGPIGLGLVRREAEPGSTVSVGEHGSSAEIVELPFTPVADHREGDAAESTTPANGRGPAPAGPDSDPTQKGAAS
jgi:folate-binding protein YgfZ